MSNYKSATKMSLSRSCQCHLGGALILSLSLFQFEIGKMPARYCEKEQVLILKLVDYFQREKDAGKPLLSINAVYERVSDALEISLSTVQRLSSNGIQKDDDIKAKKSLAISASRGRPVHEIYEHTIRSRIYAMYSTGDHVTIRSLHLSLQNIDKIEISLSSLAKSLKKLKFQWQKCTIANRQYLLEQPSIAQKRLQFLREFKANESSPFALKPVVLDETWIYSKGAFRRSWQDGSLQTVRKKAGEGARFIILHAGSEDGFIENASLIFKSGSKSGDYHNSMNSDNFEKWFQQQLIPNLEQPSLIIMDNASYHSRLVEKIPNQTWTKSSLIDWLQHRQISFSASAMKDEIWSVARKHLPNKKYRVDELALQHGHRVLKLPPYHCQFNPIETVWSECKRYYDSKISSVHPVTSEKVLTLWNEALGKVTSEKWKHYFKHTNEIIGKAWEQERLIDASDILPVIVDFDESDRLSDLSDEE